MNSNPRITFQRKLYVNRRGASGLVTYTNSYCTQQRKETRPMKTDVTGGHSETQSRSCLCRRSLCKWASLHKPSKVTVWFGAPSLEEPDNEVQFVRLFVCTTNLARPHTGGGRGAQTGMPWWVVCAILLYHTLIFHLHSGPLFFYSYLLGNTKLALTQKLLFAPMVVLKGVARQAWKTH